MPDREKVIKGLECCTMLATLEHPYRCKECPYQINGAPCERFAIMKDAISLLKDQEDEKPVLDEFGRCFLNALKRQLDMKLQMIELLITPEFAEKVVELIEKMFD